MDLSAIIIVVVLTALFFGSIAGLAIYSRKVQPTEGPADKADQRIERKGHGGRFRNTA